MVHLTTALDAASDVPLYEQLYRSLAAEMGIRDNLACETVFQTLQQIGRAHV